MDEILNFCIPSQPLDLNDDVDEVTKTEEAEVTNTIVTELSDEAKLKMQVIQNLLCGDRKTYGERLKEGAEKLGKTVRTVQRLVKKYQEEGLSAITETGRSDKGSYRIDEDWKDFIIMGKLWLVLG